MQNPNATSTGTLSFIAVEVGIEINGVLSTTAGRKIVSVSNTASIGEMIANWSFGRSYTVPTTGVYTFRVKAARFNGATANVSSGSSPQIQGVLTVTVLQ